MNLKNVEGPTKTDVLESLKETIRETFSEHLPA
jgi:ribosomal protein S28E/S33